MKLVNYESQEQLNTINGQIHNYANEIAYGADQSGLRSIANGIANINEQYQKKLDEDLNIAYMNAETDYKKRISDALTNEDSGLLHTSLGGAANIGYSFNEIESKARHEILDNLPNNNRIRDRFLRMADNDTIANSTRVQVHERSEREKYKDVTFNNNLDQSKQIAVLGFNNPNVVQTALDGIGKNIELMYGDRGEEFVKGKKQEVYDAIGQSVVNEAVTRNDIKYGPQVIAALRQAGVSEGILAKADAAFQQVNSQQTINGKISGDVDTYGEGGREKAADAYVNGLRNQNKGGSINIAALDSAVNGSIGKPYVLGSDGGDATDCGKFTLDTLASAGVKLNYRTADGQYLQAEQEGKLTTDISQAKKGDLVFWHVPSNEARWATSDDPNAINSDDKAYKGVTHVGVYMGDGKVAQAGSSGVSIVGADIYPIVGIGKFSGSGRQLTDGELLEERNMYLKAYDVEVGKRKKARAEELDRQKKAIQLQYLEMQKNGASNAELANYLDNATAGNEELTLAFGGVRNRYIAAERAEASAANNAAYKTNIVQMIQNGTPASDILKYAAENGSLSMQEMSQLNKELTDRDNGTGSYSVDLSAVQSVMDNAMDGLKDSQKGLFKDGFRKDFSAWWQKYLMEHGEPPSVGDQIWYANQIAGPKVIQTTQVNHFWESGENYQSNVALATLRGAGYVDYKPVIGDDGGHYVRLYRNGGTDENGDYNDYDERTFHQTFGDLDN